MDYSTALAWDELRTAQAISESESCRAIIELSVALQVPLAERSQRAAGLGCFEMAEFVSRRHRPR